MEEQHPADGPSPQVLQDDDFSPTHCAGPQPDQGKAPLSLPKAHRARGHHSHAEAVDSSTVPGSTRTFPDALRGTSSLSQVMLGDGYGRASQTSEMGLLMITVTSSAAASSRAKVGLAAEMWLCVRSAPAHPWAPQGFIPPPQSTNQVQGAGL